METNLYTRVNEIAQNAKGAKKMFLDDLLSDVSDSKSLLKKMKSKKKDISKQLESDFLPNSIEMDLKLNLAIIEDILKGD